MEKSRISKSVKISPFLLLLFTIFIIVIIILFMFVNYMIQLNRIGILNTIDINCEFAEVKKHNTETVIHKDILQDIGEIVTIPSHNAVVNSIDFNGDGTLVAVGYGNGDVMIWDISNPNQELLQLHSESAILNVVFSSSDNSLAFATLDRQIVFWDVNKNMPLDELSLNGSGYIQGLDFVPDSSVVLYAIDNRIHLFDLVTRTNCGFLEHDYAIADINISSDGQYLIYGTFGGDLSGVPLIGIVNLRTGQLIDELQGHTSSILALSISPDSALVASSDYASTKVWNVSDGSERISFGESATDIAFVDNKVVVLLIDETLHQLQLYDDETEQLLLEPIDTGIQEFSFSYQTGRFAFANSDNTIGIRFLNTK